jgi:hypothetical protein
MKQMKLLLSLILLGTFTLFSCKKELKSTEGEIAQETLDRIWDMGFSTDNVQQIEEGYLVEGDIVITHESLNQNPTSPTLRIAEVEQYRTFNLVSAPRTITVSHSGTINAAVSNAIDAAIGRYNAENLSLTFTRVASGGDIVIKLVNGGPYIASAGFPTSGGDPYGTVKFNKQYQNYSSGFLTTVLAHEMGHCIGFRHTDYMNRAYSCGGSGGNEGFRKRGRCAYSWYTNRT